MIVPDVNLLVNAMNRHSVVHHEAKVWWESALAGTEHIGLPWLVITGYLRVSTNARIFPEPYTVAEAVAHVRTWLAFPRTRLLTPREEHLHIFERLLEPLGRGGKLVPDAHIAALAIEHGGTVYSADNDFGRFARVQWVNPLAG